MRIIFSLVISMVLLAGGAFAQEQGVLKTEKDKVSYIIGADIGNNFKRQGLDIDPDLLLKGLKDVLSGNKLLLDDKEMGEIMAAFKKDFTAKQAEASKALGEKNKKEGEAFLTENKKKEGVITLPSGLQYKVIKEGTGKMPVKSDTVVVNYRGTLIDGTEFDSSYKRGQPATFPVGGVIAGWTEGLQLMKEGSKWELYIPANLAYGERGAGGAIGPNATLIFEVDFMSIKEPAKEPVKEPAKGAPKEPGK